MYNWMLDYYVCNLQKIAKERLRRKLNKEEIKMIVGILNRKAENIIDRLLAL